MGMRDHCRRYFRARLFLTEPMEPPPATDEDAVTTPDRCVAYVDRVGLCAWQPLPRHPGFPDLASVTPWRGSELMNQTWFWKDDLHIEKRLFYGQLLKGAPAFVSLGLLPALIAAQGDIDPRDLYEKNRLSATALQLYDFVAERGPTPSKQLPVTGTTRAKALVELQQRFLLTKHGLTGRTRGTYGYVWGLCDAFFPDAFVEAAHISVEDAQSRVVERLDALGAMVTWAQAAALFAWAR